MLSNLPITTFNTNDLNENAWHDRAMEEAILIHSKPSTRRNRDLLEIFETTKYGHAAEQFLIEQGYKDNTKMYKDLFEPDGNEIEIKVTKHLGNVPYIIERCAKAKRETWGNYPDRVYIDINDKTSSVYNLEGIYDWNGFTFK